MKAPAAPQQIAAILVTEFPPVPPASLEALQNSSKGNAIVRCFFSDPKQKEIKKIL